MNNNEENAEKVKKDVDVDFPLSGGETDKDLEDSINSIVEDTDDDDEEEKKKDDDDPGLIFGGDNQGADE